MRIIFVDNMLINQHDPLEPLDLQPHLGLLSLIGIAESAGHEALLYDPKLAVSDGSLALDESLYENIADELLRMEPDTVGLTSLGCNFICTLKIASYLKKERQDLPVLLGGPHATILDREILSRFTQFDVIARHEAELTLLPLLEELSGKHLDSVPGITFRRGAEVIVNPGSPLIEDLDTLPWPAYHHYPIKKLKLTSIRIEAGRGCPFSCTFCSTASFFGRRYRLKSPARLCDEMDYLRSEFGISNFALTHDLFTVSRKKVRAFCDFVMGRGYRWSCSARMDCVDVELLEHMREAGCHSIYYGVETGSLRMQQLSEKHQDLSLFMPILDATQRLGINATASFITGFPQEEQDDQDATLDLIGYCFKRPQETLNVQLHLLTPEPGTKLTFDYASQLRYDGHISDFNFPTLEGDDGEMIVRHPAIFMNHHYYPAALPRQRHVFVTSVYLVLYKLGFPLLSHLLEPYGKRFSRLVAEMLDYLERAERASYFGKESLDSFVHRFFENRWGKRHYIASLVRYMLSINQLMSRQVAIKSTNGAGVAKTNVPISCYQSVYVMSPQAMVLHDIHNCPEILNLLAEGHPRIEELPKKLLTSRGHYLLFLDNAKDHIVRNFFLNEWQTYLLDFFTKARSLSARENYFGRSPIDPSLVQASFDNFLSLGILIPVKDNYSGV